MKNRLAVLIVALGLFLGMMSFSGCAGLNVSVPINIATDVAFVLVMDKYPASKPAVVAALKEVKLLLAGQLTYDALMLELVKKFGDKYKYVYVIITAYIEEDKPISTTWLKLSDAYKQAIVAKIDRFLILAGA